MTRAVDASGLRQNRPPEKPRESADVELAIAKRSATDAIQGELRHGSSSDIRVEIVDAEVRAQTSVHVGDPIEFLAFGSQSFGQAGRLNTHTIEGGFMRTNERRWRLAKSFGMKKSLMRSEKYRTPSRGKSQLS